MAFRIELKAITRCYIVQFVSLRVCDVLWQNAGKRHCARPCGRGGPSIGNNGESAPLQLEEGQLATVGLRCEELENEFTGEEHGTMSEHPFVLPTADGCSNYALLTLR